MVNGNSHRLSIFIIYTDSLAKQNGRLTLLSKNLPFHGKMSYHLSSEIPFRLVNLINKLTDNDTDSRFQ